ncbi:HpcH/HpaI aldolase/citrate lyase family protein [Haloferula sp. A504]|uniref:HpcH/HpaI aldolase/citrate lyase family protein n=1 Tax=Haloferula sp. A504 TaxID=3373601 RepID=UPI0031C8FDC6|nr:HpcH/HpaI aldolase/citrate lyase family protein [Verrucomicrobiaceae bacterium E54]
MKHHHDRKRDFQFVHEPVEFDKRSEKEKLQYCLGGTLYMPGTKEVLDKILTRHIKAMTSMVMCFEDAIAKADLPRAEANVLYHLESITGALDSGRLEIGDIPLIFLRVRDVGQFREFVGRLDARHARSLSGFVFPKFYTSNATDYLSILYDLNARLDVELYGMPILEGRSIAYIETRIEELCDLRSQLEPFRSQILNVRVGGTDFSALFGVRRGMNSSIYDIITVRDCLADILNIFGRSESGYVVSAPVWEYFLAYREDDIRGLLEGDLHRSLFNRQQVLNDAIDGLLREVTLDKANGFIGKTVIHPSHLRFVNAMQAVTREEHEDAIQILEASGGVIKSAKANKMNEIEPHRSWAFQVASRAEAFGVIESEADYIKLFFEEDHESV